MTVSEKMIAVTGMTGGINTFSTEAYVFVDYVWFSLLSFMFVYLLSFMKHHWTSF